MKTYISLPISGRPIEEARAEADRMKDIMKSLYVPEVHHEVITPFDVVPELPERMSSGEQYAYCMGRDIEALLTCNQILLCPGWMKSKGCRAEREIALIYGINIAYVDELKNR